MKVALDATPLTISSGGIARYTAELAKALAEGFPQDEIVLLSDQPFNMPRPSPPNLLAGDEPHTPWGRRWWLAGLPWQMLRHGSEVFHGTHFLVPWLPFRPSVATIHDLSPWLDPRWHHDAEFVRRRAPRIIGLNLATMLITPSEAIRQQAIERFRVHPRRIVAVPLAAASHFRVVTAPPSPRPYFLFVGTIEPRKNLELLVDAWREVRKSHAVDLVLAGRRRADAPVLASEPGLRLLGEVTDENLPALYSGAAAFLYPSLYEGFGLPVLEAMQCGAAVIASRDAAVREVSGGAAVEIDACDRKAWLEAMVAVLTRPDLVAIWRQRSLRRAKEFCWAATARLTREVYDEAIRQFGK